MCACFWIHDLQNLSVFFFPFTLSLSCLYLPISSFSLQVMDHLTSRCWYNLTSSLPDAPATKQASTDASFSCLFSVLYQTFFLLCCYPTTIVPANNSHLCIHVFDSFSRLRVAFVELSSSDYFSHIWCSLMKHRRVSIHMIYVLWSFYNWLHHL